MLFDHPWRKDKEGSVSPKVAPLHRKKNWASFEGGPEVVQLLIAQGAGKNAKTTHPWSIFPAGSTPLDIAEKAKFFEMAGFLKSKGCKRGKDVK